MLHYFKTDMVGQYIIMMVVLQCARWTFIYILHWRNTYQQIVEIRKSDRQPLYHKHATKLKKFNTLLLFMIIMNVILTTHFCSHLL